MGFKSQEKHKFDIDGIGSFEFDINNIDALEAIQRGYPEILAVLAEGKKAMQEYVEYCASLGIEDPSATTTADLAKAVVESADESTIEKTEKLNETIRAFNNTAFVKCVEFIGGCLGDDVYAQVFGGKGRYLDDHVALCGALYSDAMGQRDKAVLEEVKRLESLKQKGE